MIHRVHEISKTSKECTKPLLHLIALESHDCCCPTFQISGYVQVVSKIDRNFDSLQLVAFVIEELTTRGLWKKKKKKLCICVHNAHPLDCLCFQTTSNPKSRIVFTQCKV
jgi:hypothetical protein